MIPPNFDIMESLSALIGVSAPVSAGKSVDFAELLASANTDATANPVLVAPEVTPVVAGATDVPAKGSPAPIQLDGDPVFECSPIAPRATQMPIANKATQNISSDPLAREPQTADAPIVAEQTVAATADAPVLAIKALPQMAVQTALPPVISEDAAEPKIALPEKRRVVDYGVEQASLPQNDARIMAARSVLPEAIKPSARVSVDNAESVVVALADTRAAPLLQPIDKPVLAMPDRVAAFAPLIADAVRDLVHLAQDKDVRFNVRPEALGLVAVTIERDAAGPTLRLAVETQVAAHAVRQAEPMMNDARGVAPFVQVTVDLNASDQRGRHARAPINAKRQSGDAATPIEHRTTLAATGRYA